MADIFISYSRRDSEDALSLKAKLEAEGFSVWLDVHGIEGAEQWAREIVEGITSCSTFILLLSSSSVLSENVLKELSLASEKGKRVLPVDIGFISLPPSFEYQVAGIQRVPLTDMDAIIRAHRRGIERKTRADIRKSLIILPFEDLSPEKDNQWFADGLTGEIISSIATIRSLRVLDRKSSLELRNVKQPAKEIAAMYDTRYVVEGSVLKFGDRIKISAALIDTQTLDHMWQDSFKGVMDDIFELQESVTEKIVKGLKIHLTSEELAKLNERGTSNAEAYALFMKGLDYFRKRSKESMQTARELHLEALRLDPKFATAYCEAANATLSLYRKYIRNEQLLKEAEEFILRAEELGDKPEVVYTMKSHLAIAEGKFDDAVHFGKIAAEHNPEHALAYYVQGIAYIRLEQHLESSEAFGRYAHLKETDISGRFNYLVSLANLGHEDKLREEAIKVLPVLDRHIRLTPDDLNAYATRTLVLNWSGEGERSMQEAERLIQENKIGSAEVFNFASIFIQHGNIVRAGELFRLSVERGFREVESFKEHEAQNIPCIKETIALLHQKIEEERTSG
jgi:adenylate cyclase